MQIVRFWTAVCQLPPHSRGVPGGWYCLACQPQRGPVVAHKEHTLISTAPARPQQPSLRPSLQAASAELLRCRSGASPYETFAALSNLAHCYAEQGSLATAEAYLDEALTWSRVLGSQDAQVDLLCQLAELAYRAAELDEKVNDKVAAQARARACGHALAASALAPKVADPSWEIKVLLRASDVLESCGQRVEAIELQIRAVQLLGLEATSV